MEFKLEMVIAIRYVLDLVCDAAAGTVDWTYVEGEIVTDSRGGWRFTAEGDGTPRSTTRRRSPSTPRCPASWSRR